MEDVISVIVPVYEAEQYLSACLDSLLCQRYRSLQIILVDDGSPDGCGRICDEYARRDGRIIVHHQKNAGLSAARNAGIALATGRYIGFVDADDFIEPEMFEALHRAMAAHRADIAVCGYRTFGNRQERFPGGAQCMSAGEALSKLIENREMKSYAWNKLYRRELFDGLRFDAGKRYEDVRIMHKLFMRAERVCTVGGCLYHYRIRDASITGTTRNARSQEYIESLEARCEDLKHTEYRDLSLISTFRCLRRIGYEMMVDHDADRAFFDGLMQKERVLYAQVRSKMRPAQRAGAMLFLKSPRLYALARSCAARLKL